ncbi:competence protein transcription factor [Liquorilactobacillus mali]|uniref:Competence protein transcription factor n=1 Tax=Liquorilactobacillus mali TaxID=1618 RepID=A0A0R2FRE2_9LACO|nr:competence protein transcription factor [Liquorilactobacillus mali]
MVVSAYLTTRGVFLLKALDDDGRLIWASDAINGDNYYCPFCHSKLLIRNGTLKRNHFAHQKKACHSFSEGETVEHLQGKMALAKLFERDGYGTEIESYFPELRQRPDIVIQKNFQKGIIEFQCAPVSVSKMRARSKGYKKAGFKFLWILGQQYLLKKKMTQQIAKFLKWNRSQGYYLIYYLTNKKIFRVFYNIQQTDYLPLKYKIVDFSTVTALKEFLTSNNNFEFCKISQNERIIQANFFEKDILRSQGNFRSLQIRCYLRKQSLETLKPLLFAGRYSPPIYAVKELYWKTDFIYLKKLNNTSERDLYWKIILEHQKYLFETPLLNVNRIADLQVREMNSFVDKQGS